MAHGVQVFSCIAIDGTELQVVHKLCYLSSTMNNSAQQDAEINVCSGKTTTMFWKAEIHGVGQEVAHNGN